MIGRPTDQPSLAYRGVRVACRLLSGALFRVEVTGRERLPRDRDGAPSGGWIGCGVPHRTWLEPALLIATLPVRPRLSMLADAPTVSGSWWRRAAVGLVGGVIPVRRKDDTDGFGGHVAAVRGVLAAGGVLAIFPEAGPPAAPPQLRRLSRGLAYFALRSGAPIVPVVFGGTGDLFLRRRVAVEVLAPILPPRPAPPPGTPDERRAVQHLMAEVAAAVEPVAARLEAACAPSAAAARRWRWLQGGFPRAE